MTAVPPATSAYLTPIIGESPGVRRAVDLAARFAPTTMAILLVGPTGTGKELFAQHIHRWSRRRGALIDVNCGAVPQDLIEGLFFGHRRGVFTGAVESAAGFLEAADDGTLFLDELGNLPFASQGKLLRALETGQVRRLGETSTRRVDIRVVAASQSPLWSEITAGRFRLELYQRVAGVVIELPALRERGNDVVLLARHFAASFGRDVPAEAEDLLRTYAWPGNVRELAGAIGRAVHLYDGAGLCVGALREAIELGAPRDPDASRGEPSAASDESTDRARLLRLCERHGWSAASVASALRISRATLYRRLGELGISLRNHRKLSQLLVRQSENF